MVSEICPEDGELSDYQEELESDREVDKQTDKQIIHEEESDSDGTLNESNDPQKIVHYEIGESVAVELLRLDGELSDYQGELGSNEEVDKQTGKQIIREERSDSDGTLNESSDLQKLVDYGIDESVAVELLQFFKNENIIYDNLDETTRDAIKEFSLDDAKLMITLVLKSDIEYVVNRSLYICYQMQIFIRNKSSYTDPSESLPGPNKERLREILKDTGYQLDIIPGFRRYGGLPPDYK
ncbi:hypothetical protein CHS0354_005493 [Potamilus streckersoni]|uniref:Uncharacterized protein n=1 Tax=Potamilus streckersoni TaxID=2493646 RepID=A0AAE0VV09_9BIVA|nr:hypothetical protein CHS0354_005493 [Potamilus streckersoni]